MNQNSLMEDSSGFSCRKKKLQRKPSDKSLKQRAILHQRKKSLQVQTLSTPNQKSKSFLDQSICYISPKSNHKRQELQYQSNYPYEQQTQTLALNLNRGRQLQKQFFRSSRFDNKQGKKQDVQWWDEEKEEISKLQMEVNNYKILNIKLQKQILQHKQEIKNLHHSKNLTEFQVIEMKEKINREKQINSQLKWDQQFLRSNILELEQQNIKLKENQKNQVEYIKEIEILERLFRKVKEECVDQKNKIRYLNYLNKKYVHQINMFKANMYRDRRKSQVGLCTKPSTRNKENILNTSFCHPSTPRKKEGGKNKQMKDNFFDLSPE